MDKVKGKLDWSWMSLHMPRTVAALRREREKGNGELVNECWRRGVLGQEPGWFFARENGVSVGTPAPELLADPSLAAIAKAFPAHQLLMLGGLMVQDQPPEAGQAPAGQSAKQRRVQELLHGTD